MKSHSIIFFMLGMTLAGITRAELPAQLAQSAAQVSSVPAQHQALVIDLEGALRAGVKEQDLQAVLKMAVIHKYPAFNTAVFIQKLADVQREHLPAALVQDKILEGMAKQVPSDAIVKVASQWQAALKGADLNLRAMEARGFKYGKPDERSALLNLGAGLQQRYGANEALPSLTKSALKGNQMVSSAESVIAAGNLAELLLLHNATVAQALELPKASLKAGYTSGQIQALQRSVFDQLRQGVAPADLIASLSSRQFGLDAGKESFSKPSFAAPDQSPGGTWPSSMPGGGFPAGGGPAGAPGGGFPAGGSPAGAPGGGFPAGGPVGTPGGFFQGRGG